MSSDMIPIILTFTGLSGIFLFFRIERVTEILLGDGKSALERQREGRESTRNNSNAEPLIDKLYWERLRDAIFRRNIYGIEEGLRRICLEETKKTTKNLNKTGYSKNVLPKFIKTKGILKYLKCFLIAIFFLSICSILTFLICDLKFIQLIIIILFSIVMILAVLYSIYLKTPHEKDKIQECKNLKVKINNIIL